MSRTYYKRYYQKPKSHLWRGNVRKRMYGNKIQRDRNIIIESWYFSLEWDFLCLFSWKSKNWYNSTSEPECMERADWSEQQDVGIELWMVLLGSVIIVPYNLSMKFDRRQIVEHKKIKSDSEYLTVILSFGAFNPNSQ